MQRDNFGGASETGVLEGFDGNATGGIAMKTWSNYNFIAMPSGLCSDQFACVFQGCQWTTQAALALNATDASTATFIDLAKILPPLNLPAKIAFPSSVAELVSLVKHAQLHRIKLSVKASSHSYTGSNSMRGSLMLNLRSMPKLAHESIRECGPSDTFTLCRLAAARGKTAMVRVGGGEPKHLLHGDEPWC